MFGRTIRSLRIIGVAALALHLSVTTARADEADKARGMVLVLDDLPWNVDAESLRQAIAREIGATVTLAEEAPGGPSTLTLRVGEGRHVVLSYRAEDGRLTERDVELPDAPDRAVEVISLLAGNVVRDEAAELVAALRKPPDKPSPPSPPALRFPPPEAQRRPPPRRSTPCKAADAATLPAGVDFVPGAGSSSHFGLSTTRRFSLNILGGYGAGIAGVELGGLANIESTFACGLQLAGIVNIVAGPVEGLQLAGIANAAGHVTGGQGSLINVAAGEVEGAQIGILDVATGEIDGVQAGVVNFARGDVLGLQLGVLNVALGSVKGAQLGLVNIADKSSFSLGFINVIRGGPLHVDLWGQETGILMAGLKHGTDHFHNIYGFGVRPVDVGAGGDASADPRSSGDGAGVRTAGDSAALAFTFGMGGHFSLSDRLSLATDVLVYSLHAMTTFAPYAALTQARVIVGLRVVDGLGIYAGPSYNVSVAAKAADASMSPYGVNFRFANTKVATEGWPGAVLGVELL